MIDRAKQKIQKVVFAEADNYKVLKAAQIVKDEGIATPILLGNKTLIKNLIEENKLELDDVEIINPKDKQSEELRKEFGDELYKYRQRKGLTAYETRHKMKDRNYFGSMMVKKGLADAFISGITRNYPDTIRPGLQTIGLEKGAKTLVGMYIMITKNGPVFFADTTINLSPTAEELVEITILTARAVRRLMITPRIALLSFSNFGSSTYKEAAVVAEAVKILHEKHPDLVADGEIQANFALNPEKLQEQFAFSKLANKKPNVMIFPNLSSGNIAYKIVQEMADVEAIGPILLGMDKPMHILQLGSSVREIVNMVTIAAVDAQTRESDE